MATILNDWLIRRMMSGSITPPAYIQFVDSAVEAICASTWGDGIGITYAQAAAVTTLGNAFKNNTSIVSFDELQYFTGLTYYGGDQFQGGGPFDGCSSLVSVTMPSTCTMLGSCCFRGCSSLSSLKGIENVTYLGGYALQNTGLTELILPNCVGIFDYAAGGSPIATFSAPKLESIGKNSLTSWRVESYALPSIVSLGSTVFSYNNYVKSIELGPNFTTLSSRSIQGNNNLESLIFRATTPPTWSDSYSIIINTSKTKIYVPWTITHSVLDAYKTASNWSTYANYIYELDENGDIPS